MEVTQLCNYLQRYHRRAELRESLLTTLRSNVDTIHCIPMALPDGHDGFGYRSRHIDKLLKMLTVDGDPDTTDEQLKLQLLREMLGGYEVYSKTFAGCKYFVASYDAWSKTLGKKLLVVREQIERKNTA